ncbi:DUF3310 domain-containing protein [Anaerovibrio sp. RM50]|uniref:DUF3310 domain-containing protein n=1 Tax=Anaerovibrio sp. RM50 TaxID=1200557 RepID=UPI00068426AC|nr:DUF3310 domain-containing protein [Anaerovibrio sp. RM50]
MAGKEARKIIECDCSDGGVYKVYRNLSEFAAALDVSNATAFYRIRNEKPIAGRLYLYEDGYRKKFPVIAARTDFETLYESFGVADKSDTKMNDNKNDEIKTKPEAVKTEPEEEKTEMTDKKKDKINYEINEKISEQADKQTSESDKQTSEQADMVNHPPHYCTGDIECWDAMVSAFGPEWMRAYATVTAFKYIWRAKHKGRFAEDMKKAAWYEARAAELEERMAEP